MLQTITRSISPEQLRERVYRGEILHFPQQPAIIEFCRANQQLCETMLNTAKPTQSHQDIERSHWLKLIHQFQQTAKANPFCQTAFSKLIISLGLNLTDTFCDRFIFRVVPPQSDHANGSQAHVDTHRDTWGAGIYQQFNWWGPLYPYSLNSGIEFYLDYFDQPIANNTADWSYEKYRKVRQQQSEELRPKYKSVPSLSEKPQGRIFRPQIEPGDILCFSAAHLHGSSTNLRDQCRFSFETRTVNLDDIHSDLKAPNVDNASDGRLVKLFKNMHDNSVLTEAHFC